MVDDMGHDMPFCNIYSRCNFYLIVIVCSVGQFTVDACKSARDDPPVHIALSSSCNGECFSRSCLSVGEYGAIEAFKRTGDHGMSNTLEDLHTCLASVDSLLPNIPSSILL